MTAIAEKILTDALALPPVDRAELIERLFRGFDSPDHHGDSPIDSAWKLEVESRIDAYYRGEIDASPADEVVARIKWR
uniref:Putative addiction module component, TIGR02574 family n=1 Tax=Candidatus Kentrum sp. FW TaxID=2126338 RepID=A0A450TRI2_9GAMM|nr:MAG: putative addiction module component, TIGR02574 family [Candidatus Kentron sp. FW]